MIQEFEKLYTEFSEAYRAFAEKDQAARTTISIVSRRITEAKRQTDEAIQEAKVTIADTTRSTAAVTAAGVRLEALLSRSFPVTPEELAAMNKAVAAADGAYSVAMRVRREYDEAHEAARRKIKEMRDGVFGNTPGSMDLVHTKQVLHERLRAVQEAAK
jgi:hypothetical protein